MSDLQGRLTIRIYRRTTSDPEDTSFWIEVVLLLDGLEISSDSVHMEYP